MKALFRGRGPQPTPTDLAYRRTTNCIGVALVLFLLMFDYFGVLFDPLVAWAEMALPEDAAYAVEDVLDSIDYLLSFILPGVLLYLIIPRRQRVSMMLEPRLPRGSGWLILIGMMIISTASIVNSWMVSVFEYDDFAGEILWETSTMQDYEGVLLFISTAIVPAFCEEFLFRGVICNQLRPYGKTVAVIGSAVLFGLMHQNVCQLFYATVAGVVLAILYLETKSIWAPILLHLYNNLSSVVYNIIADRLDLTTTNRVWGVLEALTTGLGLVALLVLIIKGERARAKGEGSIAVFDGRWSEEAAQLPSPYYRVRNFFSPMMTLFFALALWQMGRLLVLGLRYAYGW
jgi:membrane protease YdiL (CAAX protease family)